MKLTRLFISKKAADPNQIFIYISAIVIVGFVFLYGFKAVATFINSSQEIELAKFVKDFKSKANSVSADFGSVKFVTINIPPQFNQLCIIDPNVNPPLGDCVDNLGNEICDTWMEYREDSTLEKKNIFFLDDLNRVGYKDIIDDIAIDEAIHPNHYFCTNDGKIKLTGGARIATISAVD